MRRGLETIKTTKGCILDYKSGLDALYEYNILSLGPMVQGEGYWNLNSITQILNLVGPNLFIELGGIFRLNLMEDFDILCF